MEKKAYYIYRTHPYFGEFFPGKVLNSISDTESVRKYLPDSNQQMLVQKYFPNGLTPHGFAMLLPYRIINKDYTEPVIEFIFELVRQQHFPQAPSRLASLYASETTEQANQWRYLFQKNFGDKLGQVGETLWEIRYETEAVKYDSALLNVDPIQVSSDKFSCFLEMDNAFRYWSGEMTGNALPELLIPPPVTVIRQVAW